MTKEAQHKYIELMRETYIKLVENGCNNMEIIEFFTTGLMTIFKTSNAHPKIFKEYLVGVCESYEEFVKENNE